MKSCRALRVLFALLCLCAPAGCASESPRNAPGIETNRRGAFLKKQEITSGQFRLTIYSRIIDVNQPINVYIDGDSHGLVPAGGPGIDPAPDEDLTLRLAKEDPSDNVVFISHPCQFDIDDPFCLEPPLQTERYGDLIWNSMNRALNYVLAVVPHPQVNLIGYSGGAATAAVMAARRYDVISLRTLAGNLDPNGNGLLHGSFPQNDFIDPMLSAYKLSKLPQEHFAGEADVFVPPFLIQNFVDAVGKSHCVKILRFPNASHKYGWESIWKDNVRRTPTCDSNFF
ncbi:MAG: hypothetical protein PHE27_01165 [Alphaproteobacteria bacterium]|nr:hypothetical protein [Alphaproteobacteria bacterium]